MADESSTKTHIFQEWEIAAESSTQITIAREVEFVRCFFFHFSTSDIHDHRLRIMQTQNTWNYVAAAMVTLNLRK